MTLAASLLETVRPYTLCTPDRLENLAALCQYLDANGIAGDFVECGTYKGGSAAILSTYLGESRHIWLYDSFEGMPTTTEKDPEDAKTWIGKCLAAIDDVKAVMHAVGTPEAAYTIKPGWFDATFQDPLPNQVALLHCDADWYESVTLVLETFYPRIVPGGCIVLDDFGYWEGCREAFYDFCSRHNEKPVLERVGTDQAFWIKGRSHNRTHIPQIHQSNDDRISALQAQLHQAEAKLEQLQHQFQVVKNELEFVKASRFWQWRDRWWNFKQRLGGN